MRNSEHLPTGFQPNKISANLKLWCKPEHLSLLTSATTIDALQNREAHTKQPNIHLLKSGTRRHVIHIESDENPLVIKSFPFTRLREKLKYKKYGLAEINNNAKAKQLGISTPDYYAYFEIRKSGLVTTNGCIISFLENHSPLEDSLNPDIQSLKLAIPPLADLFRKGVNHIDISLANIFIGPDKNSYSIIDWQYCSFPRPKDPLQLAVHAAHFLKGLNTQPSLDGITEWLEELHAFANPSISKDNFISAVSLLQNRKLSIKDRLALSFDRNILQD